MSDFTHDIGAYDPRICTLVDRAMTGNKEYTYGGVVYRFAPGQVELPVNQSVARFLCNGQNLQAFVWTMDGEQKCRLAVRGASKDLLAQLPVGADDESPIEIDPSVSNIFGERFARQTVQQSERQMRRDQREQQGGSQATTVAAGTGG